MKILSVTRRKLAIIAISVFVLIAVPLLMNDCFKKVVSRDGIISEANAADGIGKGRKGEGTGQKGSEGKGIKGGKKGMQDILEADDDSDRPDWAGGAKELNPHRGDPNPTPGVEKGGMYGDLFIVVRNPVTGAPILVDGEYQICLDAACTETVLTVDGEVPEGVTVIEVDFGRASVVRSPEKVTQHALDEVLAAISAATTVTLDPAGRLVIDGKTVDSPLENLALYIAILTGDPKLTDDIRAKAPAAAGDLVAAMLAGGADKTGTITLDFLVYQNVIMGITEADEYFDYSSFVYDRSSHDELYSYFYMSGDTVLSATVNLKDFLEATQPSLTGVSGATLFTIAADDSLQLIDLIHTQIHEGLLPGTVTP